MKKWQYGLATYLRKNRGQHEPLILTDSGTLPMPGFDESERLHLDVFLKLAGERGWELATLMSEPFPAGFELSKPEETAGGGLTFNFTLQEAGDVQYLIFKREL
jgi:hypothetical protein